MSMFRNLGCGEKYPLRRQTLAVTRPLPRAETLVVTRPLLRAETRLSLLHLLLGLGIALCCQGLHGFMASKIAKFLLDLDVTHFDGEAGSFFTCEGEMGSALGLGSCFIFL